MKAFKTLLWLEYRRSRTWVVALLGSLLFWWWGLHQVRVLDVGEQLGIRAGLLSMAAFTGIIVLAIMIGRIRGETRGGQYQVLLLTPPSGYTHLAARYTFAMAVAFVYAVAIGLLAVWTGAQAGVVFVGRSVLDMVLGIPVYLLGMIVAPTLAWTVLLMVFAGAYRIAALNWVPGTVMVLASPFMFRYIAEWTVRAFYTLPGWRFVSQFALMISQEVDVHHEIAEEIPNFQFLFNAGGNYIGIPQEPFWAMLILSIVMLVIAGRIWQEVEA